MFALDHSFLAVFLPTYSFLSSSFPKLFRSHGSWYRWIGSQPFLTVLLFCQPNETPELGESICPFVLNLMLRAEVKDCSWKFMVFNFIYILLSSRRAWLQSSFLNCDYWKFCLSTSWAYLLIILFLFCNFKFYRFTESFPLKCDQVYSHMERGPCCSPYGFKIL